MDWKVWNSDQRVFTMAECERVKRELNNVTGCPPSLLVTKEEAATMQSAASAPVIPKQSEPDRIWDLIVLAAESSRYGT